LIGKLLCVQCTGVCSKTWMRRLPLPVHSVSFAPLSTSSSLCKNRRSAVPKVTNDRSKVLTYEQAQYPEYIGLRKSWNSWNTSMW